MLAGKSEAKESPYFSLEKGKVGNERNNFNGTKDLKLFGSLVIGLEVRFLPIYTFVYPLGTRRKFNAYKTFRRRPRNKQT